jgi:RND family efflux transporter MFP subunit
VPIERDKLNALRIARSEEGPKPPHARWLAFALAALAVIAAALSLWQRREQPALVEVAVAESVGNGGAQNAVLSATGYVVARRLATISSKVTGRVSEILVEEGMSVEAGQVLARLDDATAKAELALAESQLAAARNTLNETTVRLQEAQRTLTRSRTLREQKLTSQADLDAAEAEVEALKARLDAGRGDVDVAERSLGLSRQNLDDLTIRAPFAGVVVSKDAQPGEMISPVSAGGGFTRTGICTVVDMDSREIEIDVNEAYINRVEAGQQAMARLDAYPDWNIPAHVINIVPTADRQKATVRVRMAFDQLDPRILPDMGVRVDFLDDEEPAAGEQTARGVASVPAAAMRRDGDTDYVLVLKGDALERRAVRVGRTSSDSVELLSGVRPGERVVTTSDEPLSDGQRVRVN